VPKTKLPASIRAFVAAQSTVAMEEISDSANSRDILYSPYGHYWQRAFAAMLLTGRVKPKNDGLPNRTDINRICKEANCNQRLFESFGGFLVHANIIERTRANEYQHGEHASGFWDRDVEVLSQASRRAFFAFLGESTGHRVWRPTLASGSNLDAFVGAFAQAFEGRAFREDELSGVLVNFSRLPVRDLQRLAKRSVPDIQECNCHWESWLDKRGLEALLSAVYRCSWAYAATHRKQDWIYVSDVARIMLALQKAPPPQPLVTEFRVLPNLCIFAGADLAAEKLVPLFRSCNIKRIDRVLEFQLDKRRLMEAASGDEATNQLQGILSGLEPLPATVKSLLGTRPVKGKVRIRGCSAIVKPEDPEILDAIKKHRRLKGYLEAGGPRGYLLIKSNSDPHNFVRRCQEFGFTVEMM